MIHVYKAGGGWVTPDGIEYTVKAINPQDKKDYLAKGWVASKSEVVTDVEEAGVDGGRYERELRDKIKRLGGKPGGRAK
ncbi:MAG: hypothetical protein VW258_12455, partial [Thalassolituus sp.]